MEEQKEHQEDPARNASGLHRRTGVTNKIEEDDDDVLFGLDDDLKQEDDKTIIDTSGTNIATDKEK